MATFRISSVQVWCSEKEVYYKVYAINKKNHI